MKSPAKNLIKRVVFIYRSKNKAQFFNTDPTATTVTTISNGTHSSTDQRK
jgi:hypothetical protein